MAATRVVFYREDDGSVPALEWLDSLATKAQDKVLIRIERLKQLGHELRRPEADYLRDGVYELRIRLQSVNYRLLYFFHDNLATVLSHGIVKERTVPAKEIDWAIVRKHRFARNPAKHTYAEA